MTVPTLPNELRDLIYDHLSAMRIQAAWRGCILRRTLAALALDKRISELELETRSGTPDHIDELLNELYLERSFGPLSLLPSLV